MQKRHKSDTLLLGLILFLSTGAMLAYNIYTSDGGSITVSLSELIETVPTDAPSLIYECALPHLSREHVIYTSAEPTQSPTGALLPPIVTPPEQ